MEIPITTPGKWDELAYGRQKWETFIASFLRPVSTAIIDSLHLHNDLSVLDVATGTGEPGLTAAGYLPAGSVTGIDISETMLAIAVSNARKKGIVNFKAVCCDVTHMPFPDHHFDAAMCRNGVAFFPDLAAGLQEICRVVKPGGRIAVSTWSLLEKNLWIKIVLDAIQDVTKRRSYNNHVPGMFYGMQAGFITDWFEEMQLCQVEEQELTGIVAFNSIDEHWDYVTSVSAAVTEALKKVDEGVRHETCKLVKERCKTHVVNDKLYFQWTSRITTGMKPY